MEVTKIWLTDDAVHILTADGKEYTTTDGDGEFTGTPMYFQDKTEPVTFTAYYPFTGSEGTAPGVIKGHTSAI